MLAVTANPFFCGTPGSRTPMSGISHRCIKSTSAKVPVGWPGGIRIYLSADRPTTFRLKAGYATNCATSQYCWLTPGIEPCSPLAQSGTLPDMLTSTYIRCQEGIRTPDSCSKNRRVSPTPLNNKPSVPAIQSPSGISPELPA